MPGKQSRARCEMVLEAVRGVEDVEAGEMLSLLLLLPPTHVFPMLGVNQGAPPGPEGVLSIQGPVCSVLGVCQCPDLALSGVCCV